MVLVISSFLKFHKWSKAVLGQMEELDRNQGLPIFINSKILEFDSEQSH